MSMMHVHHMLLNIRILVSPRAKYFFEDNLGFCTGPNRPKVARDGPKDASFSILGGPHYL